MAVVISICNEKDNGGGNVISHNCERVWRYGVLRGTNYSINEVVFVLHYRVELGKLTQPSKPDIAYFNFKTHH